MVLEFYDQSLNLLGVVDEFQSLTWERFWQRLSTFDLTLPMSADLLPYLEIGNFIMRDDINDVYMINSVEYSRDINGYLIAHVMGVDSLALLNQRIVKDQVNFRGQVDNLIARLLFENAIPHEGYTLDDYRSLGTLFSVNISGVVSDVVDMQIQYDPLLDKIYELCVQYRLGIRGRRSNNTIVIDITVQEDHSDTIFFSDGMENLASWSLTQSNADYKSIAYIAGEGEGANRAVVTFGQGRGLDRFEIYVDARDLTRETETGVLPPDIYRYMLRQRGNEELINHPITFDLMAEGENVVYHFPDDYNLGYIVYIETFNTDVYALVAGVTEIIDANGYSIFPTFEIIQIAGDILTEAGNNLVTENNDILRT